MKISGIIYRKLKGHISLEEEEELAKWLDESNENKTIFEGLKKMSKQSHDIADIASIDTRLSYEKFKKGLKRKRVSVQRRQFLRYAAVFAGLMVYGYYFYNDYSRQPIKDYENLITLELEDGEIYILDQDKDTKISSKDGVILGNVSKNQMTHSTIQTTEIVYTTLRIPKGKKFEVVLSDGTEVFLNSGSSLRYPLQFIKGEQRDVFLKGEGFFSVEKDADHPFIVHTDGMEVEVLGTEFNITAYPEDLQSNTVLVEGSVKLSAADDYKISEDADIILEPGFKVEFNKSDGKSELTEVDTEIYTSWRDGKLIFKRLSFRQIIKILERHYDVEITNTYSSLNKEEFSASFDIEPLEEVLTSFSENKKFKFIKKDDRVLISKP